MVDWTFDAVEVRWMTDRLSGFWDRRLTAVAPTPFPAYGRLLHPARNAHGQLVRWAEVGAQHGIPLTATSHFPYLALPEALPKGRSLWTGDQPEEGTLDVQSAERLLDVLASHTTTFESVTFALWDGLGWDHAVALTREGQPSRPVPDVIPSEVRRGPRMRIPHRDYIVYRGSLCDALFWMPTHHQTPHYWWPHDHAWAIAGDVDLSWTIVAGSKYLIDALAHDGILEVLPLTEDAQLDAEPPWLTELIARATRELLDHGAAIIETSRGAVGFNISSGGEWLASDHRRQRLHWDRTTHPSMADAISSQLSTMLLGELGLLY